MISKHDHQKEQNGQLGSTVHPAFPQLFIAQRTISVTCEFCTKNQHYELIKGKMQDHPSKDAKQII